MLIMVLLRAEAAQFSMVIVKRSQGELDSRERADLDLRDGELFVEE
jgi:hypothetical protein